MNVNLRWIFFSEELPRGRGVFELVWVLLMATIANLVGYWGLEMLLDPVLRIKPEEALGWTGLSVALLAAAVFIVARFTFLRAGLIGVGLALSFYGFHDWSFPYWQLEVAFGYFLALRVFSKGPR